MNKRFIKLLYAFIAVIIFIFQSFQCLKNFITITFEQTYSDFNFLIF